MILSKDAAYLPIKKRSGRGEYSFALLHNDLGHSETLQSNPKSTRGNFVVSCVVVTPQVQAGEMDLFGARHFLEANIMAFGHSFIQPSSISCCAGRDRDHVQLQMIAALLLEGHVPLKC